MIVIGIDPGTGKTSPTALAVINTKTMKILCLGTFSLAAKKATQRELLRGLTLELDRQLDAVPIEDGALVCIETFVMRGKGGETLQRLIGAYISRIPSRFEFTEVYNTTMKRIISGSGAGDKLAVAKGLLRKFRENPESIQIISDLIESESWDEVDAIGLALAGYELTHGSEVKK